MNEERKVDPVKTSIGEEKSRPGYDEWFRDTVEKSMRETDSGAQTYSAEEVWRALGLDD